MDRLNWAALVRRIEKHRSGTARFFKPVCVIAAIDLADEGRIDARDIDARAVIDRFSDYVTPIYPDRGRNGYQPLWRLTNDRLWTFFNRQQALQARTFPPNWPGTEAKLLAEFDRLAINEDFKELWTSSRDRRALRDLMLLMLDDSDNDSRRLVAPLFDPQYLQKRARWPTESVLKDYFKNLRDQPGLFEEDHPKDELQSDGVSNFSPNEIPTFPLKFLPSVPEAIEDVPTPTDYYLSDGRIFVGPNSASLPIFPNVTAAHHHAQRLQLCVVHAQDLIKDISRQRWQVREDYTIAIKRYLERLPTEDDAGNILLADAVARVIREMFAADRDILPTPFAASLKALLQQHIALRPFYPQVDEFYRAVKTGRIDEPLPLDAVSEVISVVRAQTPTVFDESVSAAIDEASSSEIQVAVVQDDLSADGSISPPPDPLGELEPTKAREFQIASSLNSLWKVFKAGSTIHAGTDAWIATYRSLSNPIKEVLVWLSQFLGH